MTLRTSFHHVASLGRMQYLSSSRACQIGLFFFTANIMAEDYSEVRRSV